MKRFGASLRFFLPAMMLALPGCMTIPGPPRLAPGRHSHGSSHNAGWWQCLGDAQLSALAERGLDTAAAPGLPTVAQTSLSFEIAHRTIALRAQQSALVLLAARADLDNRLVAMTRQHLATAQLAATRAEQSRTRAEIAGLRERLAVLTGSAPALLDSLPGGPVPLPPVPPAGVPSVDHDASRAVAIAAQSQVEHTRMIAALADMQARTGKLPASAALSAERQAIGALQTEQQARAAMTQAFVAQVASSRRRGYSAARQQ